MLSGVSGLGFGVESFRSRRSFICALSGRLTFTVRPYKFYKDPLPLAEMRFKAREELQKKGLQETTTGPTCSSQGDTGFSLSDFVPGRSITPRVLFSRVPIAAIAVQYARPLSSQLSTVVKAANGNPDLAFSFFKVHSLEESMRMQLKVFNIVSPHPGVASKDKQRVAGVLCLVKLQ